MKLPFGKNKKGSPDPASDEAMTLTQHLAELRSRIIRSVLAVTIGMMGVLAFYEPVLRFLRQPYDNVCKRRPDLVTDCDFFSLGPLEGFNARLKISLYGGLILALPVAACLIRPLRRPCSALRRARFRLR